MRFELERPAAVSLFDIDNRAQKEILTIHGQTGRVKLFQLHRPEAKAGELAGQLIQYGFGQQGVGRDRDLATGDVTGDGRSDVVVTDPESAQMIVYQQVAGTGLDQGNTFPGLIGSTQVRIADLDGDKTGEVVVLSAREKAIGVSRMEKGRLTFPQSLALAKDPVALDVADLNGDGSPEVIYISKDRNGSSPIYALRALQRTAEPGAEWKPYAFGDQAEIKLVLKGDPERLVNLDADGDGKRDFIIFHQNSDRAAHVLEVQCGRGACRDIRGRGWGLRSGQRCSGWIVYRSIGRSCGPGGAEQLWRNLKFGANNQWQVVDQYNALESNAKIAGVAALNLDGQPGPEIVLVDLGVKKLRVLRKEGSIFRPWREVEIGSFSYKSCYVADLNGDKQDDLAVRRR